MFAIQSRSNFTALYTSSERDLQHIVCWRRSRTSTTGKEKRSRSTSKVRKPTVANVLTCGFRVISFCIENYFCKHKSIRREKKEKKKKTRK